ncbi:MAG TPA: site-2 protease family protein [Acidimicrobiales bacterium]|jgi:Zn-dependent protease
MKESVRLGRIAGVTIGFNWSLVLIAAFLAIGLGNARFPTEAPGYPGLSYAAAGVVTALAFLACILIHEISHAVVAKHEGLPVDGIVLWLMGGYTRIGADPSAPGAEFRISGAGPLASLLLGLAAGGAAVTGHHLGISRLGVSMLEWLAMINILLAVFNILPGSPLDGGRILHAGVWAWTHDRWRASRLAAQAGRVIGVLLVFAGVAFGFLAGSPVDGLWFVVIGWFLFSASRMEERAALLLHHLDGLSAADVMAPFPSVAPGWLTVQAFLEQFGGADGSAVMLLQQWAGGVSALTTLDDLRAVPQTARWSTRAIDISVPLERLPVAGPGESAEAAIRRMEADDAKWVLVVDAGHIVGAISEQMFLQAAAARPHVLREPAGVG